MRAWILLVAQQSFAGQHLLAKTDGDLPFLIANNLDGRILLRLVIVRSYHLSK